MNKEQLIAALDELFKDKEGFFRPKHNRYRTELLFNHPEVKRIAQWEELYYVHEVYEYKGTMFETWGSVDSWSGCIMDNLSIVKPVQVMRTEYERTE